MNIKNKFLYISILAISFFILPKAYTMEVKAPSNICVLLEQNTSGALLEVKGPYNVDNPYDATRISSGLMGKRYIVRPTNDGIRWNETFPGYHQIRISPKSEDTSILLNGIQYNGSIIVYKTENNLQIVNEISIEDYIKSILSQQFPYPLEHEVMSSVAIAARTTAYFITQKNKDSFWHVKASEIGYQGSTVVIPNSTISQAVDATRHLILVQSSNESNAPFVAEWTEHSAGKTASYKTIYRKNYPSPEGVAVPHAALDRKDSKWSYSIEKYELSQLVSIKNIQAIDLFVDKESNKIYALRVKNDKENKDFDFIHFQNLLGKDNLLSNDFNVDLKNDKITFTGHGKGAGVGICLHSASSMAQNGAMAVKILSSFYPNTYLVNLSAMPNKEIASK